MEQTIPAVPLPPNPVEDGLDRPPKPELEPPKPVLDGLEKPPKPPVFFASAPAASAPIPPAARPFPEQWDYMKLASLHPI